MGAPTSFVNGIPQGQLPLTDRGLNYGHGLFETARIYQGSLPLWPWHRARLLADAAKLGIQPDAEYLEQQLHQALSAFSRQGIVKLTVTAGVGGRGYRPSAKVTPNYLLQYFPLPLPAASSLLQPCRYRLPLHPPLAGIKHLNRLDQVLAATELEPGREALLLDTQGRVIEALNSNLFCLHQGQWLTPDLSRAGVNGVMRRYLLEALMPGLSLPVRVADISLDTLAAADEIFCCNAVHGVWPVIGIAGLADWSPGSHTRALKAALAERLPCFAV